MKNDKTVEDRIKQIAANMLSYGYNTARDLECWNYYNERYDDSAFEYLTKVGEYTYPARLRIVGKQRPLINLLVSTQARRPFVFNVRVLDKKLAEKKYQRGLSKFIEEINIRLRERVADIEMRIQPFEMQLQQIEQMIQQQPESEEQAAMIAQLQAQLPVLRIQVDMLRNEMMKKSLFTKEELQNKERFQKYTYKDIIEEHSQVMLSNIRIKYNAHDHSVNNFKQKVVTGKEFYYVNYEQGNKDLDYYSLNTMSVFFPQSESTKWIQDGDWVGIMERMTLESIKDKWGHLIPKERLDALEKMVENHQDIARTALIPTSRGGAVFTDSSSTSYNGNTEAGSSFDVYRIWFKRGRWAYAKESPNPHKEGGYFFHIIREEDLDKVKKDEKIHKRFVYDRYMGIVIDKDIFVECKKDPIQPRPANRPSQVYLPVVGYAYSDVTNRPYSLIWSTKDLQDLYRVVHYMRELVIATSGVRTKLIDMSQLPMDDMTLEEQQYHAKMGRLYIKTRDDFGRIVNSSFNQWRDFDDTLQGSIQYYTGILDSIDNEIGTTMGISYSRRGERTAADQVGTNQQAQRQSELITELMFYEHDQVEAKALSIALKLEALYITSPGELIEGVPMDMSEGSQFSRMPKQKFGEEQDFEVLVVDSIEDQQRMNDTRMYLQRVFERGQFQYSTIAAILNSKSLKEMEKKFEYFEGQQAELMDKQRQAAKEDAIQVEQQKIALANEYEKYAIEMNAQAKQLTEEVKMQIAKMQDSREGQRLELERAKMEADNEVKVLDIATERDTEENYLDEQRRTNTVNEELERIRLQMDWMMEMVGKKLDIKKEEIKARSQARAKERIKD